MHLVSSNCTGGNNIQAGIYDNCTSQVMDLQCACDNDFILTANNFVLGEVYWIFIDGCGGADCDISIDVTAGLTAQQPPGTPGAITGLDTVCVSSTNAYSIAPTTFTSSYEWTVTPSLGTPSNMSASTNIAWGSTPGTVEVCVTPVNACLDGTPSCKDVVVIPPPTAELSGSGQLCGPGSPPVPLTVTFTGVGPWQFVYRINGVNQPPITTYQNPYTLNISVPGTITLASVSSNVSGPPNCPGTVSGSVVITNTIINTSFTATPSTCGLSNGGINLTVSGGTPGYNFNWSNGEMTEDLISLVGGQTYTVTVVDANGCTKVQNVNLTNTNTTINLAGTTTPNTTCDGNDNGAINLTITPANPNYDIDWSNGATTEDLTGLAPGTYTVTVSLGPTCTATASYTIANTPNNPNVTISSTPTLCELETGNVNITVSGGVAPYTFEWSNGETTEDLTTVLAGPYTVTVTGANGCTKTATTTVANSNPPINIIPTIVANTTCPPNNPNGSISINISPAVPPGGGTYQIEWSDPPGGSGNSITMLEPGSYSVTVDGGGACTQTATFVVPNNPNLPNVVISAVAAKCELANGSVSITVSGGVPPYTFEWSNGATTEDLTGVPPDAYTVTVTGANGCTKTASVTVNNTNPPITITPTIVANTTCPPNNPNGSISINISPAVPPGGGTYQIEWSDPPGGSGNSITMLEPGSYSVTVDGGGACTQTATFNVPDNPNNPNLTATTTDATCELANGNINVSVSGGVAPYTYLWSSGQTTQDLSNVAPGNYTVTVTAANGCTDELSIDLDNNNPPININSTIVANTTCPPNNPNGSISISITPATPPGGGTYLIEWSTPPGGGGTVKNNLPPGTYSVTVTGGGACTAEAEFDVPDNPNNPNLSATTTDAKCELANGDINVSVSGGVSPYTYLWSSGQTTQDLNNVVPGNYTVTVTGANGCTDELSIDLENDNPPIDINAVIVENSSCAGGNGSISISISPTPPPGAATYIITWSNPPGGSSTTVNNLPAGTYSVTVNGGGACTAEAEFEVPASPNLPEIDVETTPAACDLANGDINITPSGGQPPYMYLWSNGATTQDLLNVLPGTYSVTMTDAAGCVTEATIDLENENPDIEIDANINPNTACVGGNGSISISISPQPPPAAPNYTITWSNPPGGSGTVKNNLPPGTYSVTVSGGGSCTQEAEFEVPDEPNLPEIDFDTNPALCELANGDINMTPSNGQPPYTYLWSSGQTTQDLLNVLPGTYSVTVTGANGCTSEAEIELENENPEIQIDADIEPNTSCTGGNGSISLSIDPNFSPLGTPYIITWSNPPGGSGTVKNNLPTGTYSVTVSGGGACTAEATFDVPSDGQSPEIEPEIESSTCSGNNGSITLDVSGGQPPYTYLWGSGQTTSFLINIPSGDYSVTVTDANGCVTELNMDVPNEDFDIALGDTDIEPNTSCKIPNGSLTLDIDPPGVYSILWSNGSTKSFLLNLAPGDYTVTVSGGGTCTAEATFTIDDETVIPVLDYVSEPAYCGEANGSIEIDILDGTDPFSFQWSNGSFFQNLSGLATGNYTLTVTGQVGCTATLEVFISDDALNFSVNGLVGNVSSCVSPNGEIQLEPDPAENDLPPGMFYNFDWSNGDDSDYISDLAPGTYTVTVSTGKSGCTQEFTFQVEDEAIPPTANAAATAAICGLNNGSVNLTATGINLPLTFLWSNGVKTEDLANVPPGTYTLTVTDFFDCSATASATVGNNNLAINITPTTTPNTSCASANGAISLNISPAGNYTFSWSNSQTTQNIGNLAAGNYTVTVSAGGTCTATTTILVENNTTPPDISENVTATICGDAGGAIDLSANPASAAPFIFSWSNSSNSEDLAGLSAGNFTVTVTDKQGCTASKTINVPNNSSNFQISGTATPVKRCDSPDGSIDLTVLPAGNYLFSWSNSATSEDLQNLAPGNYTVTVNAAVGVSCPGQASFTILDERVLPLLSQNIAAAECGLPNGSLDLTPSGGTPNYTFSWSTPAGGGTAEDLQNVVGGNYAVTATDANGCTATAAATIPDNSLNFSINGTPTANTSCGTNTGAVDLTVSPAGNYSFSWSNGATTEDISAIGGGNFSVTISAGGTCTAAANFNVPTTTLDPQISQTNVPALCGEPTGEINLTVAGGVLPYVFDWSNGAATEDLTNLASGIYSVTATGSNGCTASAVVNLANNSSNFNVSGTPMPNSLCPALGGTANGEIDLTISPSNTYKIIWSTNETSEDLAGLAAGNYAVTVTQGLDCTKTANFTVGNDINAPNLIAKITSDICNGSIGAIDLTASGATPFQFLWSNNATTEDLTNLPAGNYAVTLTAGNGCTISEDFSVGNNSNTFTFTGLASPNTLCSTSNGKINLTLTPANGTFIFTWSNGAATEDLANLPPGNYTVTIFDGGTCTAEATYLVENNTPAPQISGTPNEVKCFGDLTGSINLTLTSGQVPYIFNWSPSVANPTAPQNLAGGNYGLTVTDVAGCSSTAAFLVAEPTAPLAFLCQIVKGASMPGVADGAARLTISGGTAPYFVDWSPGGQQAWVLPGIFDLPNLKDGNYGVTVTDAKGCTTVCDFEITAFICQTKVGSMDISAKNICGSDCVSAIYNASAEVLDIDDVLQFVLHTGSGTQILGEISRSDQPNFCFDASKMVFEKTYFISAVAGNSVSGNVDLTEICTVVAAGTPVIFHEIPVAAIAPHGVLNCSTKNLGLVGSSNLPGANFSWSTSGGGQISGAANQPTATASHAGNFQLIINLNGCADTAATSLGNVSNVIAAFIQSDPAVVLDCVVKAVNLTAEATGSNDVAFIWMTNGTLVSTSGSISVEVAGIFNLIAQDTLTFCADTANIEILDGEKYPPLAVSPAAPLTCKDTLTQLSGGSSVQGLDFQWITVVGADTISVGSGASILVGQPGIYFFVGTDLNNKCTNSLPVVVVSDLKKPVADAGNNFTMNCFSPVQFLDGSGSTGVGGLQFSWTTIDGNLVGGINSAVPGMDKPGNYELVVTQNGNGCTDSDLVKIDSAGPFLEPVSVQPKCFGEKGTVNFSKTTGGTPPYRYSIDGGLTFFQQKVFQSILPGNYLLVVQDALGCEAESAATIGEPQQLMIDLATETTLILGENYQISTQINVPESSLASILWTPTIYLSCDSCLEPLVTPFHTTIYKLTVADSAGCRAADEILVKVVRGNIYVPNIFNPTGGDGNEKITIFADTRSVVKINSFQIFDRWGERVFENYNFPPNDPSLGWDGRFLGKDMNPAVFVWWAEVEFFDGEKELLKGDVTLKR